MKLKGINPIEQNCDKIAVGITGVAAVGVVAMTFLTQPNAVQPGGKGDFVPPAAAFAMAEQQAGQVQGKLDSTTLDVPEVPRLALATRFDAGLAGNPGPRTRVGMGNGRKVQVESSTPATSERFATLAVPAPTLQGAKSYQATVSPIEQYRNKDLAKLLPTEQPFDKAYVSIEGVFNGQALRDMLEADPDGDGPMVPIPIGWWRDAANSGNEFVGIAAVEVERQTISLPDGTTPPTETVIINSMPGRESIIGEWSKIQRAGDVGPLLERANAMSDLIQRPVFYDTIAGPKWVPPSEVEEDDESGEDNSRQIDGAKKKLAKLDEAITDLRSRIDTAPGAEQQRATRDQQNRQNQGNSRGGGGGKGGPGNAAPRGREPQEKVETKESLQRQIDNKTKERERLVDRLVRLGEKPETLAPADPAAPPVVAPVLSLLETADVKVWAHDVTAQRGAVYRYRLRVVLNNPLFGRALSEEQASLGASPLMSSAWTDWSSPVEVLPSEYFFITSAETESDLTPRPRATAEMFQFYYGFYRRATVSLEPGDKIEGEAKLPAELKFADMKKVSDLLKGEMPVPGAPAAPTPAAPAPDREGRRRTAQPGGPQQGGPIPGAPPAAPKEESALAAALLTEPAPKSRVLRVDAALLDVAPVATTTPGLAGGDRPRFLAIFRDLAGRVITRLPEAERSQKAYRMLESSARAGLNQGKVEVKAPEPDRPKDAPPREPRPGKGGGGGGGGGGG